MRDNSKIVLRDSITRPGDTTQYAAGDVISAVTTNNFHVFASGMGGKLKGTIEHARIMINANQATKPDLELWLFSKLIAEVADNSAFAPTDTEILTLIDVIEFAVAGFKVGLAGSGASGNIVQVERDLNIALPQTNGTLYGQLVARNTYTPIADENFTIDLQIQLG
jgi:hypothetical protein